jgi:hypothetical protein
MPRGQESSENSKKPAALAGRIAEVAPRRKRPLLLAAAAAVMLAWLCFLAVLTFGG